MSSRDATAQNTSAGTEDNQLPEGIVISTRVPGLVFSIRSTPPNSLTRLSAKVSFIKHRRPLRAHLVSAVFLAAQPEAALNILTGKAVTRLQFLSPATFPRNTVIEAFGRMNVVREPPTTVVATGG